MPRRRGGKTGSMPSTAELDPASQTVQLLMALLMVTIDERESRADEGPKQVKTEVLLSRAGLSSPLIAMLMGKQPGAVRTTLSRAKGTIAG